MDTLNKGWSKSETEIICQVRMESRFIADTLHTVFIDRAKGVKAIAGKLRPEYGKGKKETVYKYLFILTNGWTLATAQSWIKDKKILALVEMVPPVDAVVFVSADGSAEYVKRIGLNVNHDTDYSTDLDRCDSLGIRTVVERRRLALMEADVTMNHADALDQAMREDQQGKL